MVKGLAAKDPVVIVSYARTPIGNFLGSLSSRTAPQLAGVAIGASLQRAGFPAEQIDDVLMGCVLPAGIGQAPARQAAFCAGLSQHIAATTVNKMCGSGMKTVMLGHDMLLAGSASVIVAGGMESMSNTPYLLPNARRGYRMGDASLIDHMLHDGLQDAYDPGKSMGYFAEQCAQQFGFSRDQQDEFALRSLARAQEAVKKGWFAAEIEPVEISNKKQTILVEHDEGPQTAKPEKIPQLKPAFVPNGSITAANSSSISDGAAALALMKRSKAKQLGITPIATIIAHATHAQAPAEFTTAPITAIQKLLDHTGWTVNDVDLFEINEAFAVVTMAAIKELKLPTDKVNIHGGACVLGHPIGASGARIIVTLLNALQQHQLKRGIAALCIGGGEATAIAVELS